MKFTLGTKSHMTEIFSEDGTVKAVTVIQSGPIVVTQVKGVGDKNGYNAIQVGYGAKRESLVNKPEKGHVKELGGFKFFKEFRVESKPEQKVGDKIEVSVFTPGDVVEVSAISKGKGFQGVVKRHDFRGGQRTHGQKHSEREPGAIGGGARAGGRVAKGLRMAGRMGGDRVTVKNLRIVQVDAENGLILVSGAVPGRRGTLVEVRSA